jgi:hypothetical protein
VTGKDKQTTPQGQGQQQPQTDSETGKKNTVAGGTNFNWGDANSHDDVGFTPFFDKNILELKGPLPLTIFNKTWQDAALAYHAEKRPKTDDNSTEKGLPYPSEWCMTYSNWNLNYAEFTVSGKKKIPKSWADMERNPSPLDNNARCLQIRDPRQVDSASQSQCR